MSVYAVELTTLPLSSYKFAVTATTFGGALECAMGALGRHVPEVPPARVCRLTIQRMPDEHAAPSKGGDR